MRYDEMQGHLHLPPCKSPAESLGSRSQALRLCLCELQACNRQRQHVVKKRLPTVQVQHLDSGDGGLPESKLIFWNES